MISHNREPDSREMTFEYEKDPQVIERESFLEIRKLVDLEGFDQRQQQVVMRIVHSLGMPALAKQVRFSKYACAQGIEALGSQCNILCDVEMVKQGVTKRMVKSDPICFLNDEKASIIGREKQITRSMAAVELWQPYLADSVVLIGNAPTALYRLIEMIEETGVKPALIVGMPVGFIGAAESKQCLWDHHEQLSVECITLLGREGGSAVTAASCNALLRCIRNEWY